MSKQSSQSSQTSQFAAGVLPIAFHEDTCLFLIGDDIRGIGASDLGGKHDRHLDKGSVTSTASREFFEESLGVSITAEQMRRRLTPAMSILVRGKTQNGNPYSMFITEIPFDPAVTRNFSNAVAFLTTKNIHRSYVEKTDLRWVDLKELLECDKRIVFRKTIETNEGLIREIGNSTSTSWLEIIRRVNGQVRP
jgi:hypothetical protein